MKTQGKQFHFDAVYFCLRCHEGTRLTSLEKAIGALVGINLTSKNFLFDNKRRMYYRDDRRSVSQMFVRKAANQSFLQNDDF